MTPYQLKRRAIQHFKNYDVPRHVQRRFQRQWIYWIRHLGDRWLLAVPVKKGNYYG